MKAKLTLLALLGTTVLLAKDMVVPMMNFQIMPKNLFLKILKPLKLVW